ncbi:Blp family class II bacteriocin [Flavobacterium amniphilum]|uniref:Blp family class II bacteriocin n=1 Tax=Flavobacterium amniphilum TaxID=1834035 RepID=UPI00202A2E90|nr:Blp family class II bacteriocin [Flavobacterium amniphilum]MCL9807398.1 Blp family class II bacteriocin [Flavobacterium amniphilum]
MKTNKLIFDQTAELTFGELNAISGGADISAQCVLGTIGSAGTGALAGAAAGSVIPGLGTGFGAAYGAIFGAYIGIAEYCLP